MLWLLLLLGTLGSLIGIVLAYTAKKKQDKETPKVAEFAEHLNAIGCPAEILEKQSFMKQSGYKPSFGVTAEGFIRINNTRNLETVFVYSISSQYGTNYYLEYIVSTSGYGSMAKRKNTRLVKKRSNLIFGEVVDTLWKGDEMLARSLNNDYNIKDTLMQANIGEYSGSLDITADSKRRYVKIRTGYAKPSRDVINAFDCVAGYVKSAW